MLQIDITTVSCHLIVGTNRQALPPPRRKTAETLKSLYAVDQLTDAYVPCVLGYRVPQTIRVFSWPNIDIGHS